MDNSYSAGNLPVIPDSEFAQRMHRFKEKMAEQNIDLVVAFSTLLDPSPVRYFSDFSAINESAAMLIPLEGDPMLCSGQACQFWAEHKSKISDIRILPEVGEVAGTEYEVGDQLSFASLFEEVREKYRINRIGTVGTLTFPAIIYNQIRSVFPSAEMVNAEGLLYELRATKSANEIACMRKAANLIDGAFEKVLDTLEVGMTELDIQAIIVSEVLRGGGEDTAATWAPMIPSGAAHSKLCMNRNTLRQVQEGEIICLQAGALYEGYNAPVCYPMVLGAVPEHIRSAVQVGSDAVQIVLEHLRPGATSREVNDAGRGFLEQEGYAGYSPYGLIHTTGLLECESPWLPVDRDFEITEGMTMAIDMFFFNLDWGSFRIEDTVAITGDGHDRLTKFNEKNLARIIRG